MRKFVHMGHKAENQTEKVRFYYEMASWEVLEKYVFLRRISMDMWGNVLRVLKVYKGWGGIGKRNAEEDCWSLVMKKNCAWQTFAFIRQKENHL